MILSRDVLAQDIHGLLLCLWVCITKLVNVLNVWSVVAVSQCHGWEGVSDVWYDTQLDVAVLEELEVPKVCQSIHADLSHV